MPWLPGSMIGRTVENLSPATVALPERIDSRSEFALCSVYALPQDRPDRRADRRVPPRLFFRASGEPVAALDLVPRLRARVRGAGCAVRGGGARWPLGGCREAGSLNPLGGATALDSLTCTPQRRTYSSISRNTGGSHARFQGSSQRAQ